MKNPFRIYGYNITTDPYFEYDRYEGGPELESQFEELLRRTRDPYDKEIIQKLNELIIQYPRSPQLKNYLTAAYHVRKDYTKATELNDLNLSIHPDYLFAKLNKAHEYIESGKPENVPGLLGEKLEIKELYPDRDTFHLSEITNFQKTAIRYFLAINKPELAKNRLELMNKIAPVHPDTIFSKNLIFTNDLGKIFNILDNNHKKSITPVIRKKLLTQTESAPVFNHKLIWQLYEYEADIPDNIIKDILSLPRETLIEDLESILVDVNERYLFFSLNEEGEESRYIVIHAFLLLKEIAAEESLPMLLEFLKLDEEIIEFWLGDHLTYHVWQCIFVLGKNHTDELCDFLLEPGIDAFSKSEVSCALCQIAMHEPSRRGEINQIFRKVFTKFLEAKPEDNFIDTIFLDLIIENIIECRFKDLLPLIKGLYEKGYMDNFMSGDYDKLKSKIEKPIDEFDLITIQSIFEMYKVVLTEWNLDYETDYLNIDDELDENYLAEVDDLDVDIDEFINEYTSYVRTEIKTGRNDPCPCGSGKKYKKCCLGNDQIGINRLN